MPSCGSLLAGSVDVTDELSDALRSSHPYIFARSRAGSTGWLGKVTGSHDTSGKQLKLKHNLEMKWSELVKSALITVGRDLSEDCEGEIGM